MSAKRFNLSVLFLLSSLLACGLFAQIPIYNGQTNECEGQLKDSDNGPQPGQYNHNENYVFTICIPGAKEIIFEFISFATEENHDFLKIFDGPDTLSPLLLDATGQFLPNPVIATSGCLTIQFKSDANIAYDGFLGKWYVDVEEPVSPKMTIVGGPTVPCASNQILVMLDKPVVCDSLSAANFQLQGPSVPSITAVAPSPCGPDGKTDKILLTLSSSFQKSGNYLLKFNGPFQDACGRWFDLGANAPFAVNDCPLNVQIYIDGDTACAGTCVKLVADASGGDPATYTYKWSISPLNQNNITICPKIPQTVSVTVTDGKGSKPAVTTFIYVPKTLPTILNPKDTLCSNSPFFNYKADLAGGIWKAKGVADWNKANGGYEAWRTWNANDTVTYTAPNGCVAKDTLFVKPFWAGSHDGSCTGGPPFQVSGGSPAGGIWSGTGITPGGLFTPNMKGTFTVTYTHPNGCMGSKNIYVDDLVKIGAYPDTVCRSKDPFIIPVTPYGGVWTGTGIDWADGGRFNPSQAKLNADNVLIYDANGCKDTIDIFVADIRAGEDFVICSKGGNIQLPGNWGPPGGVWKGPGVIDSISGIIDPSGYADGKDIVVTYQFQDCSDSRVLYVRNTVLDKKDTLAFCIYDDSLGLNQQTPNRRPQDGVWSGPGVNFVKNKDYFFRPSVAGAGLHALVYTVNSCPDTLFALVHPLPVIDTLDVCSLSDPLEMVANPPGGYWVGTGIIDNVSGLFAPEIVGPGTYTIGYTSPAGCYNEGLANVTLFEEVSISGILPNYCYRDTMILVQVNPAGGTLTIDGIQTNSFNPALAGPGIHKVEYVKGTGKCADQDKKFINVGLPISIVIPTPLDSVCSGDNTLLTAVASGGLPGNKYVYTWDQGLGFGQSHYVYPLSLTQYTVTVSDGCSEPASAQASVYVYSPFQLNIQQGPRVCFGDSTFASLSGIPQGSYLYTWNTTPAFTGSQFTGSPGFYNVNVQNQLTGCEEEFLVELPGYEPVKANFILAPNKECISTLQPEIEIIDLSQGASNGTWDFGDQSGPLPYVPGAAISHIYQDTGHFTIELTVQNDGGCISVFQRKICVFVETRLWAPNAFSPNGDGVNELYRLKGSGIETVSWQIYNRYGEKIFEGQSLDAGWDGRHQGSLLPAGNYVLLAKYRTVGDPEEKVLKSNVILLY